MTARASLVEIVGALAGRYPIPIPVLPSAPTSPCARSDGAQGGPPADGRP